MFTLICIYVELRIENVELRIIYNTKIVYGEGFSSDWVNVLFL